jgi:ribosome-associated heat shock protein Hsp15
VVRTRSDAARLVEAGHVRINGVRTLAPAHAVRLGDVITVSLDRSVRLLRVIGFCERRGPPAASRELYEALDRD